MSQETTMQTEVKELDVNLDELFGSTPGAESVLLPEEQKPSIFSNKKWKIPENSGKHILNKYPKKKPFRLETTLPA